MASRNLILLALALFVAVQARPDKHAEKRQAKTSLGARLVGGSSPNEGRLEVYRYPDGWGTICDDWFETVDAEVACSMMGFSGGEVVDSASSIFGEGTGDIVLDNVECTGTESNLWDCPRNEWGEHNCGHYEDVGIRCESESNSDGAGNADIRLVGGTGPHEGRVEVYHDGEWGTVCDDWWETPDAEVVCRQLGFSGGEALRYAEFGEGEGPIWLDSVECDGHESSIASCDSSDWGVHDCTHYEDASVRCNSAQTATIRLVNGNSDGEGRVEVYHNGEWGTVCDDSWDDTDATIVCQALGYASGEALEDCEFGEGTGQIWLDEVDCWGWESDIGECDHNEWGDNDCSHYEDAGVICSHDYSGGW